MGDASLQKVSAIREKQSSTKEFGLGGLRAGERTLEVVLQSKSWSETYGFVEIARDLN